MQSIQATRVSTPTMCTLRDQLQMPALSLVVTLWSTILHVSENRRQLVLCKGPHSALSTMRQWNFVLRALHVKAPATTTQHYLPTQNTQRSSAQKYCSAAHIAACKTTKSLKTRRQAHQESISDGAGLQHTVLVSSSKECAIITASVLRRSSGVVINLHPIVWRLALVIKSQALPHHCSDAPPSC